MHQPTGEFRDHADGLDGLFAAGQLDTEKRQQRGAEHMQPMGDLVDRQAGFVGVQDRLLGQDLDQSLFKSLQGLELLLAGALQRGFTDCIAEHFRAHLSDPATGSDLSVVEVSQQRANVFPILNRGVDLGGKIRRHPAPAVGAFLDFGPIFGAGQLEGGHILDLAADVIDDGLMTQVPAARTAFQGVDDNLVGMLVEGQRAPGMVGLTAGFAPRSAPQTSRFGLLRSVSGRRQRTITAILSGRILPSAKAAGDS